MAQMCVTYLPHAVGGPQTLSLPSVAPGFEHVFKHGRLPSLRHHLHAGAGRVVLGLDVTLGDEMMSYYL